VRDLWADFRRFAEFQLSTGDYDPVYPVLRWLTRGVMTDAERVEWIVVYVAFYDVVSAVEWYAFADDEIGEPPTHCGTERRGHRDGRKLAAHLESWRQLAGGTLGAAGWLRDSLVGDPSEDWRRVQERLRTVYGNGPWAAYKTAELLQKVTGWPLHPSTLGLDGAFGPRAGVELLAPEAAGASWDRIEVAGTAIAERLEDELAVAVDLAQIETCLCDFNSLAKGLYYVGNDLDLMAVEIAHARARRAELWVSRRESFDRRVLVEASGPPRYRRERRDVYARHGAILAPWEELQGSLL
jgi:hypothetical protein